MKRLMFIAVAAAVVVGCKSIKLEKVEHIPAADGTIIENAVRGEYYAYGLQNNLEGLQIEYSPKTGVRVAINRVSYDMSNQHAEIVDKSLSGAAELAGKVGAAMATSGTSVAADAAAGYIKQLADDGGKTGAVETAAE